MRRDETAKKIGRSRVTSNKQKTEEVAAIAFVPKKKMIQCSIFFIRNVMYEKRKVMAILAKESDSNNKSKYITKFIFKFIILFFSG